MVDASRFEDLRQRVVDPVDQPHPVPMRSQPVLAVCERGRVAVDADHLQLGMALEQCLRVAAEPQSCIDDDCPRSGRDRLEQLEHPVEQHRHVRR